MRTIQKRYKTLKGFEKAIGFSCVPMVYVLNGYYKYKNVGNNLVRFHLTIDTTARKEAAELLAKLWSKSYRKAVEEKVVNSRGDNTYLQCFYLERSNGKYFIGNSLSGPNYDWCKRMWLKS